MKTGSGCRRNNRLDGSYFFLAAAALRWSEGRCDRRDHLAARMVLLMDAAVIVATVV
jgi:hypothetical protein